MTHWYVIQTKRKHETQVADDMARENLRVSVPLETIFYRTKENRANGTRSRKSVPAIAQFVFLQSEFVVPIGHIDGKPTYLRMSDYEYATIQDWEFREFCEQIDTLNRARSEADALKNALAVQKASKQSMEFKAGLQAIKARMMKAGTVEQEQAA